MSKKKWKAIPCLHETWKFERTYRVVPDISKDKFTPIMLKTCKKCNVLLGKEVENG